MARIRTVHDFVPQTQRRLEKAATMRRERARRQRAEVKALLVGTSSEQPPVPTQARRVTTAVQRAAERAEQEAQASTPVLTSPKVKVKKNED